MAGVACVTVEEQDNRYRYREVPLLYRDRRAKWLSTCSRATTHATLRIRQGNRNPPARDTCREDVRGRGGRPSLVDKEGLGGVGPGGF